MQINLSLISSSLHNITELSQKRMEVIEALKALGDVSIFKNSSPASCGIESATAADRVAKNISLKNSPL